MLDEFWLARMAHGVDAALREGQIDGLGEVEWCRRGISKIWPLSTYAPTTKLLK
jgi:hypothetical protein